MEGIDLFVKILSQASKEGRKEGRNLDPLEVREQTHRT